MTGEWSPRTAEVSRRLRSRADAILGAVWFMPQDGLPALAARAACMGRVPGRVAAALFAPQHPERVTTAVDEAWRDHEPGALRDRGLVDGDGALTDDGREYREDIERATDLQEADVVEALGEDVDELFELMAPWARTVVAAAGRIAR